MGIAVVVIANDFSAINVALPTMEKDFDTNINTIQWVVNAYALTFGVMIVTGGRLADMFGRRNAFFLGTAIFASMSALGGAAQTRDLADRDADADGDRRGADVAGDPRHDLRAPARREGRAGRRDHHRRRRARQRDRAADRRRPHRRAELALDLLPQRADLGLRRRSSPTAWSTSRSPKPGEQRIDYPGIAAISVGLVSLLVALDQVDDWGWGDPRVIGLLALAAILLVAFVPIERRAGRARAGPARGDAQTRASAPPAWRSCLMSATFFAALLYLPQFMQKQLGYSPLEAGVGMLPFLATFAARLLRRRAALQPARGEAAGGRSAPPASPIAPVPLLAGRRAAPSYGSLVPGMVVLGIGIGSFYPTATTAGVTSVDESQTSLAGGIVYMFQIAGGSIGLGLTTTVFSAAGRPSSTASRPPSGSTRRSRWSASWSRCFFVGGRLLRPRAARERASA